MSSASSAGEVVVGAIGKAFGLRGEVYVHPDPDIGESFRPGRRYHVVGQDRVLTVADSHVHAGRQLVHFKGVGDRSAAEALRGLVLTVPRDAVELDEDAFWAGDLLGAEVVDDAGDIVGVVDGFRDGHAHDYLVIARPDGGEVLVPAVSELVEIAPSEHGEVKVTLHPIPGLLDPDQAEVADRPDHGAR